jgi:hypothetical protein
MGVIALGWLVIVAIIVVVRLGEVLLIKRLMMDIHHV